MSLQESFTELRIPTVTKLIEIELCIFFYKLINDLLPTKLAECVLSDSNGSNLRKTHCYSTREKHLPNLPSVHDFQYKNSFLACSNQLYNALLNHVKKASNLSSFCKQNLKNYRAVYL